MLQKGPVVDAEVGERRGVFGMGCDGRRVETNVLVLHQVGRLETHLERVFNILLNLRFVIFKVNKFLMVQNHCFFYNLLFLFFFLLLFLWFFYFLIIIFTIFFSYYFHDFLFIMIFMIF